MKVEELTVEEQGLIAGELTADQDVRTTEIYSQ